MISLQKPFQWEEANDTAKAILGLDVSVKVFQSLPQAIFEITNSLQALYSFKKQYYHQLGFGTHADEALISLSKQGTKGIEILAGQIPVIDDKKTLFILNDVDDAITGAIYQDPQAPTSLAVFRILVSHSYHRVKGLPVALGDWDIHVLLHQDQSAVALLGRRAQNLAMPLSSVLPWSAQAFTAFKSRDEEVAAVTSFEAASPAGAQSFFTTSVPRLMDRALVWWPDLDASAVREILIAEHGFSASQVECVGLSRWNEARLLNQFVKRGFSADQFRGLLLLSADAIKTGKQAAVAIAAQKARSLSKI